MAKEASAMMPVVAQPSRRADRLTVNFPIWVRRLPTHIIAPIIGTATNPLITALQNNAQIEKSTTSGVAAVASP